MASVAYLQFNQAQQGGTSTCGTDRLINDTQVASQRIASSSMPFPEAYLDTSCFPVGFFYSLMASAILPLFLVASV